MLESYHYPSPCDLVSFHLGKDVLPKFDRSASYFRLRMRKNSISQCRFTGAVRSHYYVGFSFSYSKVNAVQDRLITYRYAKIFYCECGHK